MILVVGTRGSCCLLRGRDSPRRSLRSKIDANPDAAADPGSAEAE
jgi:hypothetical protein